MPRRVLLSAAERASLVALPDDEDDLNNCYEFSEHELAVIRRHRGAPNRLGFAVQLCYMRYPGIVLGAGEDPHPPLLRWVAKRLGVSPQGWSKYGRRDTTRREHLGELQVALGFTGFNASHHRMALRSLDEVALQTDKGILLAQNLVEWLRRKAILLPAVSAIESICAEAVTRANRRIYATLTARLSAEQLKELDGLLQRRDEGALTWLAWLRLAPGKPNARQMMAHIERLKKLESLQLPDGIERQVHQNRLLKIAREGGQMSPSDIAKLEPTRRRATLAALVVDAMATIKDQIVDLHDHIMGKVLRAAKNRHQQDFQQAAKSINEKVRHFGEIGQALLDAKEADGDAFGAIEAVMSWESFAKSVAEAQSMARPADFDHLHRVTGNYNTIRRYAPAFLEALDMRAAPPTQGILDAVAVLRKMNADGARKVPEDAPTAFVNERWKPLVFTEGGVDRRYYEMCALFELKNSLRAGDISVRGSRHFKDFDEYLLPIENFALLQKANDLPVATDVNCEAYLKTRLQLLEQEMATVDRLAAVGKLPGVDIDHAGLKITPLDAAVPDAAERLIKTTAAMLPRVKITELLMEVDSWTGFTRHFTHLKRDTAPSDKTLLMTAILADAINLGLTKMTEACPGITYGKLAGHQTRYIRDETYSAALAELVNAQSAQPFAAHCGDGTTSSSDGQFFRAGGRGKSTGQVNPKYGAEPGRKFYTHISDQYAPYSMRVINVGAAESTHVLDGLLYHESDLRIEEHYTDTGGFTDHVFGMTHLLGFRFAPRIRNLDDMRLHIPRGVPYPALQALLGDKLNVGRIRGHWDEILRLATSIKKGAVTASLIMRKLSSYPRQNGLALALREFGRIERTLFVMAWLQDPELRRKVHIGLNKGEARHALARAVFFCRLGELRDRSIQQQRYRASGLNLVTAAIALWNTVYLERAIGVLRDRGHDVDQGLLQHLSPLGWEHINLTGDYLWKQTQNVQRGRFRSLKQSQTSAPLESAA